jgi:hypothetical protein
MYRPEVGLRKNRRIGGQLVFSLADQLCAGLQKQETRRGYSGGFRILVCQSLRVYEYEDKQVVSAIAGQSVVAGPRNIQKRSISFQ